MPVFGYDVRTWQILLQKSALSIISLRRKVWSLMAQSRHPRLVRDLSAIWSLTDQERTFTGTDAELVCSQ
jgi:hypothetical protein